MVHLSTLLFTFLISLTLTSGAVAATWNEHRLELTNENCLGCHGIEDFTMPNGEQINISLHITPEHFQASSHSILNCIDCHDDLQGFPHQTTKKIAAECTHCHQQTWDKAQLSGATEKYRQLPNVLEQIDHYRTSIHAQPNTQDPSRTNAYCNDCHDPHYLSPINPSSGEINREQVPAICGRCHDQPLQEYRESVHGQEVLSKGNLKAAICTDCHSSHAIEKPAGDNIQLLIGKNCGNCHEENMLSYINTYHGQVNTLGETQTAKCYDCHGSHGVKRPSDPLSMVHPDNIVETCNTCHETGGAGFATFAPHGTTDNFDKYPGIYIAYHFMIWLLIGVFSFFYLHSLLWFYAEWRDRRKMRKAQHINTAKLQEEAPTAAKPEKSQKFVRRFGPIWRIAHLILALGVMILVITGMALLFPQSAWAPMAITTLGGVESAGLLHRIGGLMFATVFFGTTFYAIYFMIRNRRTWQPFGPNSMIPNLNDLWCLIGMFKWFFGLGPRPHFDRWAYWEKFDFWAPFWGLTIVGVSGVMLWNPEITSHFLPGWSFNVATIVHGEEAFLAAVFLFSVHYFNCHFRPDKFPQDICMFTGCIPLDEYKHEHSIEYDRLVANGELESYLVDPPSTPMKVSSLILGAVLILIGVGELILVVGAFFHLF